ncbi:hypothetical protein BDV95DRAFT_211107 [Massariosphaeria phaeospora]|uniref:Uncharacterized protein n=1 Tax=Massariosphaeria phaeospora TaxID=100035 RepID=A0A7C8M0I2_9PLEO|nr:hypothetical protein BDV95DRAFT_211107 [Massariosphaeria phaeospora]
MTFVLNEAVATGNSQRALSRSSLLHQTKHKNMQLLEDGPSEQPERCSSITYVHTPSPAPTSCRCLLELVDDGFDRSGIIVVSRSGSCSNRPSNTRAHSVVWWRCNLDHSCLRDSCLRDSCLGAGVKLLLILYAVTLPRFLRSEAFVRFFLG